MTEGNETVFKQSALLSFPGEFFQCVPHQLQECECGTSLSNNVSYIFQYFAG